MSARARTSLVAAIVVASFVAGSGAACDPVHTDAQARLGGETPGIPTGPLHRAGQPCLVCHDGSFGNPPKFVVAGTIFHDAESRDGLADVSVHLRSDDGSVFVTTTNSAGNFYVPDGQLAPLYPMRVSLAYAGKTVEMQSLVGRDGSCGGCHSDPSGPASPGHIHFYDADGGTP